MFLCLCQVSVTRIVALNSSFQLARFPGGSHNETWTTPNYYQTINYFLDEVKESYNISESPDMFAGAVSPHGVGQTQGGVPDLACAARDCAQCLMSLVKIFSLMFSSLSPLENLINLNQDVINKSSRIICEPQDPGTRTHNIGALPNKQILSNRFS